MGSNMQAGNSSTDRQPQDDGTRRDTSGDATLARPEIATSVISAAANNVNVAIDRDITFDLKLAHRRGN